MWDKLKILFKLKTKDSLAQRGYPKVKRQSFLDKDFSIKDSDFKFFTTARFLVVSIIILLTPLVANLGKFINSKSSVAICVGEHFNAIGGYSFLEYEVIHSSGEKEKVIFTDQFHEYTFGEKQKLLYLPEDPSTFILLTAEEVYFNFWGSISFGILMIWVLGYVASRDNRQ